MTASDSRLNNLYPALSAKERALLILHAWQEGGEEDRLVRSTMPHSQVSEFNRYIGLMNGPNQHLSPLMILLQALADQLSIKYGWILSLALWGSEELISAHAVAAIAEATGRDEEGEGERSSLDRFLELLLGNLCERMPRQWQELRSVEVVVGEIEQEFGEDPLLPELKDLLANVRATLADLHQRVRDLGREFDLPEPDREMLDSCRRLAYREVPDRAPQR